MVRPTAEQQKQWNDEGYLVFEKAIQDDNLKRLQDHAEKLVLVVFPEISFHFLDLTYHRLLNILLKFCYY